MMVDEAIIRRLENRLGQMAARAKCAEEKFEALLRKLEQCA